MSAPEIVMAVANAARQGADLSEVLERVCAITARPEVTRVGDAPTPGRPARFTTRNLQELEREVLRIADDGRGSGAPRAGVAEVMAAIAAAPVHLSDEQRALVATAALSEDRVVCVVGVAGAGKTTALRALANAMERADVPLLGAAPSGRAAEELRQSAGISARTLHSPLAEAPRRGGLPHGSVLVIDEAGMAETRVLAPVLRMLEQAGGKAILVGDPAQLPSVGAGGLYGALCARLGSVELSENRRQRDEAEREALARLRSGDAEGYLGHLARAGRLVLADDAAEAKARLVADWWAAASRADVRELVMIAQRRADVEDLNAVAREFLADAGRLGEESLVAGGREFRVGDRVVCRRNDSRLGVCNGTRALVSGVDSASGTLALRLDGGPPRMIPAAYAAEHLEHGYAITGHGAQGGSVERAFVLVRAEGARPSGAMWLRHGGGRRRASTGQVGRFPTIPLELSFRMRARGLWRARLHAVEMKLVRRLGLSRVDVSPALAAPIPSAPEPRAPSRAHDLTSGAGERARD